MKCAGERDHTGSSRVIFRYLDGVLNGLSIFQFDLGTLVPFACLFGGGFNFHRKLLFTTLWPIGLFIALGGIGALFQSRPSAVACFQHYRVRFMIAFMSLLFVVYTAACSTIFLTFGCERLDSGRKWLKVRWHCRNEFENSRLVPWLGLNALLFVFGRRTIRLTASQIRTMHIRFMPGSWSLYTPWEFLVSIFGNFAAT